jgi:hypothetical protein
MSTTQLPSGETVDLLRTPEGVHRGIVRRADPSTEPKGADLTFSPDYTVTSTDDKGGRVLTNVEVILVFWGSFWSATPAPSPSRDKYEQAIRGIVTGPYLGELAQYRGVGQGSVVYSEIFDGTDPSLSSCLCKLIDEWSDEVAFEPVWVGQGEGAEGGFPALDGGAFDQLGRGAALVGG